MLSITIGSRQADALTLLCLDPCHVEWREERGESEPAFSLDGRRLTVSDPERAAEEITDLANGCDDVAEGLAPGDAAERAESRRDRDALTALASRVRRTGALS